MSHIFKQMLVVAGYFNGRFVPLIFVFETEDYARILEFLTLSDRVKLILADFEKGLLNALKEFIDNSGFIILVGFF